MGRPKGGIPWNKGIKGLQPWMNTLGLNRGTPWNKGKSFSQESRRNMSDAHKARFRAGALHPMLGKKHDEATKDKFHLDRTGKPHPHKGVIGDKNPFWKGGITPVHRLVRTMGEYYIWRDRVFERDNHTCLVCGVRGGKLNADHIIPFSFILGVECIRNADDARKCAFLWDIENGRTLCEACHKKSPSTEWRMSFLILRRLKQEHARMI
jgi:RNA polymerase subunit RPABC4/transcription elongation factor Spt4